MIKDIPEASDFYREGLALLNIAWDTVLSLVIELEDSEYFGVDIAEVGTKYWELAKQQTTTSLALAQQGVELILKAKIAEISPFLLIGSLPRDYPKLKDGNVRFADFRTIDAQDLIKVHDYFSSEPLAEEFRNDFDELRKKRNVIFHTPDRTIELQARDLIVEILSMHFHLISRAKFLDIRRRFLERSPRTQLYGETAIDSVEDVIVREMISVIQILKPEQLKKFFDFNKKQRSYVCPGCERNAGDLAAQPKSAVLQPNTPTSTKLYCFICDDTHIVERRSCGSDRCKGNVISFSTDICCTCGDDQTK